MKDLKYCDKILLVFMVIYSLFGLLMITSASSASSVLRYNVSLNHFFSRQLVALGISFVGGFLIMGIPIKKLKGLSYLLYALVIGSLIFVLINGKVAGNAQSWIKIFDFQFQPSEFAKSLTILALAYYYSFLESKNAKKIEAYFLPLVAPVLCFLLIAIQPDYGSAIILALITMFIFFCIPQVKEHKKEVSKVILIGAVLVGVVVALKSDTIFTQKRLDRIFKFTHPCSRYQEDSGYQVCNGYIAISNGGLFGVGLGKSTQKYLYLPESHTDFIFPIICEELGALVGIGVVIGYAFIMFRIIMIFKKSYDTTGKIIALGTFAFFFLHVLINLLGVLALMPLTGVPLPLLSYGGSFTINILIMLFFTERVAIENNKSELRRKIASM